jgi:hypothetical protein
MKTKTGFLTIVLTLVMALPMIGQKKDHSSKNDPAKTDLSKMMGKPTYELKSAGLGFRVWVMTQEEHMKKMEGNKKENKGMNEMGTGMDPQLKDAMMAGTHHIMLEIKDASSKIEITNATANVQYVTPFRKSGNADLKPVMNHFGNGITLREKGEYQFTVNVTVGGIPRALNFKYTVK